MYFVRKKMSKNRDKQLWDFFFTFIFKSKEVVIKLTFS